MNAQLQKLIDSRRTLTVRPKTLTKDQQDFLITCRHHDYPVTYPDMITLWKEAGWGIITESVLRKHVRLIEADPKLIAEIYRRLSKDK